MGLFSATVRSSFPAGSGGGTNTWHLRTLSDDGSATEINALMGIVKAFYEDLGPAFPTAHTWTWDGTVTEVGTASPSLLGGMTGWTQTGAGGASNYGGAALQVCFSWKTTLATRRGRGRTFVGPLMNNAVEANGTLETTFLTGCRTAAQTLVSSSLADTNGAIVVWSELDQVGRDVVASSVTDQGAVLRSRR